MKFFNQYKGLRKEIYVLFACKLIDNVGSLVGPMLALILSVKLGMSASEIAIFSTIFVIISLPVGLYGGKISDKFNKKLIINIGDITTSLIYIICGIIGINKTTIIIYYIGSMIQQAENSTYESLVADFSIGEDREKASSLLYLGLNLGLVLSPTIGGLLLNNHLQLMFILSGISELLSIIVFDIFIKDTSALIDTNNIYESKTEKTNTIQVLKDNKVIFMFMIILAVSAFIYNMWAYLLPITITQIIGENGSVFYGTLSSLNCIVVVLCTVPVTSLISKFYSINRMMLGNFLEMSGFILFIIFIKQPIMYYLAIFIFTIGEIVNTITTSPHLTKRIPMNYRARITSLLYVMENIFCSIGQIAIGFVYDNVGINSAWTVIIAIDALTILAYQLMKKKDKNTYPNLYKEQD